MKLRVEISSGEEEILIRCKSVDDKILRLQNTVSLLYGGSSELSFFLGDTEYFIAVQDILILKRREKKFLLIPPMECIIQTENYMS